MKDVARLAGVSLGTVSNVLNWPERVSPERRARVERAIAELGFVRNESARQLRAGASRTIAIVVLDLSNPFFGAIIAGAEEVADGHDVQVVVCNSGGDPEREARHLDHLIQQQVLGILLSPVHEAVSAQQLAARRRHPPVVFVDRVPPATPGFASVAVDDVHGGALVGELLSSTGHDHVAFAGGPRELRQVLDRLLGLRSTFRGSRIDVVDSTELTIGAGEAVLDDLLARPAAERPTAVFCANDLLAIGVLNACARRGVAVPDELSIVGYDDIDLAATAGVPLTTVAQPARGLGRAATRLLLADATEQGDANPVFTPELVVRSSTRAIAG